MKKLSTTNMKDKAADAINEFYDTLWTLFDWKNENIKVDVQDSRWCGIQVEESRLFHVLDYPDAENEYFDAVKMYIHNTCFSTPHVIKSKVTVSDSFNWTDL